MIPESLSMHASAPSSCTRQSSRFAFCLVTCAATALATMACSESNQGPRGPLPEEVPLTTFVAGGKLTSGFKIGRLTEDYNLDSFRITTHPITVKDYRHCVNVGACPRPSLNTMECRVNQMQALGPTYDFADGEKLPLTCATPEEARQYCQWIGGRLPSSEQWLLATRGPTVRRYAWGDKAPSCSKHALGAERTKYDCCDRCTTAKRYEVGAHPTGASPAGVQDALLTTAELLRGEKGSQFPSCNADFCIIYGLSPGAIDFEQAIASREHEREGRAGMSGAVYALRCVWEGAGQ